jgi:hypothetical protein
MVEIKIMVEGGSKDENADAATMSNTESLRQSFHRIFQELFGKEVGIVVELQGGHISALVIWHCFLM